MVEFLSAAVEHGGIFAYLLIALGVFALAVAIERFYVLNFRYSINGKEFWKEIRNRVQGGRGRDAHFFCPPRREADRNCGDANLHRRRDDPVRRGRPRGRTNVRRLLPLHVD